MIDGNRDQMHPSCDSQPRRGNRGSGADIPDERHDGLCDSAELAWRGDGRTLPGEGSREPGEVGEKPAMHEAERRPLDVERRGYPKHPFGHVADDDSTMKDEYSAKTHDDALAGNGDDDETCVDAGWKPTGHHNRDLGKRGEEAAARFLKNKGFTILERNWECIAGEADIIAQWDEGDYREIHFIEVKTRTSTWTGFPWEAVNEAKRYRYERIAEIYLCTHDPGEALVVFDIMSLVVTGPERAFMRMHTNVLSGDCG